MRALCLLTALLLAIAPVNDAMADGPLSEVRLGILWPDLGPPSGRLPGADLNGELLFTSPFAGWSASLPGWLRWAVTPRVNLGGSVNTAGATNQGYAGLTWTVPLATSLLHQDDGLSFGFSIGPELLGGSGTPRGLDQGAQIRLGAEVGYQVTPRMGLYMLFDHVTGGPLFHESESINELGVRVGLHF
jgi:lipid A 3-O-deacylase